MLQKTVKVSTLILAFILLLGVLSMIFGFYNNDSIFTKMGISITIITSLTITFQTAFQRSKNLRLKK
jgi:K+ transporter